MGDAPLIVGVSGLRGIVGESLTPEVVVRYAGAFGAWLNEQTGGRTKVLICADGRDGWQLFLDAATAGLCGAGCEVLDCGVLMTPSAGFVCVKRKCDAAVIVTASHNPQEWNGLKLLLVNDGQASAPDARTAAVIIERFESGGNPYVSETTDIGVREYDDPSVCLLHADAVFEASRRIGFDWFRHEHDYRVVVDSVNASGTKGTHKLLSLMMIGSVQLFGDDDGLFPHTPEPTAENLSGEGGLCDAVPGLKADVGFAQDPDADRLAIVDENGKYIGEEYTLALCAEAVLSGRKGEGKGDDGLEARPTRNRDAEEPVLVANLSTSRMIDDVAAKHGGRVVRTPVGEANVVEVMKKLKAEGANVVLGGEGNGGVIWPEVVYVRDSLSSMALVLSLMARTGKTVSELVQQIDSYSPGGGDGSGYAIVKRKVSIASKADASPAVKKVSEAYSGRDDAAVDLQDGVRVDFPERGLWVHVRASNTEPIMRLIAEGPTAESAEGLLAEVEGVIGG